MLQVAGKVNGAALWANLHLLFWLSLIPFVSGWMGENHFATIPVAVYGFCLLMCALAFTVLSRVLVKIEGPNSNHWLGFALYCVVAAIWFIPDSRIEKLENR